jgi:hypothetical protein
LPRVFISYSHDSEDQNARVAALAGRLRADGITIVIDSDQLPGGPDEGWPQWSERQVKEADLVLVACTLAYSQRYDGNQPPGNGLGVVCEAGAIRQYLYDQGRINQRIRVVLFDPTDAQYIPSELKAYHFFQPGIDESYASLLAWLRGLGLITPSPQPDSPVIEWPAPSRDYVSPLADRKDEFTLFERIVTGQIPKRILLLRGISNTGKTVLLTELLTYARQLKLPAASLDFKGCPSLDELFEALRLDLGAQILRQSFAASGTARFYQFISDLQHLSGPLVLFFDTYQEASADSQKWLEGQLLPRLDRAPAVIVVIGGQQVPGYDTHAWRVLVEACELRPIQRVEDWLEYSARKWQNTNVKADHVEALTLATGGNPGQLSALLETMVRRLQTDHGD